MSESNPPKPVVVVVRDGWGHNPDPSHDDFNAVHLAETPGSDGLKARFPHTRLHTSSRHVGLPTGTMGNSEVGHQNIGAGRVVNQESTRITVAAEDGSFFENVALLAATRAARDAGKKLHLLGIASDAGVHGLMDHLYACLELARREGLPPGDVCLHLFSDGRDTGPFTGKAFLREIEAKCREIGVGRVVSLIGRYFAMDRDSRWERVARAHDLLTGRGETPPSFADAASAAQAYYDAPTNDSQAGDEFITPRTIGEDPAGTRVSAGDAVVFYNYRGDRPRELVRAFMQPDFHGNVPPSPDTGERGFDRGPDLGLRFVCMTAYDEGFTGFPGVTVAYPKPPKMGGIGGEVIAEAGLTQFRCAETEKFPHVTFFANDYREAPFPGETRGMAQSPKVATYDLQPEMSADEVTRLVLEQVESDACPDFILVNYANGDMVGHTGKLDAAIAAVEKVDACVTRLVDAVLARGGALLVTADHGNAEQMFDPSTGSPHTAHTLNDVDCIVVKAGLDAATPLRFGAALCDVMPTVLDLLGLDKPAAMTGATLLVR
ncbi:2,3-bisphosphoglycerate-independent phosphoglycerate mutase [Phycisphaera mikurensis]|uniref:2,3-bisphosphoglycerate-independent phosphoglycerate mutase n=1 Tax=Phycisphaera mikurensis (strain NBRC 102666 / KCTC 22515 / FYK2301M01) TaxID=1142394 RepID=I0IEH6_PHYMF|nr:2,3-bisphosphoglycerate-independent phosphoglycerate mutase [Phycisphaera mikurensis]MBB6441463.1 2,3-bisphosphoglycerate-independent phosphoglycerate mutase [Phycisphaera mikurensis]BAM03664.1 2,3-bisphosphoglycerate-independent phosphoglycerate mutase [Phycisphaera mikurensis NBRC 102666]